MIERYGVWLDGAGRLQIAPYHLDDPTRIHVCDDPMCHLRIERAANGAHWPAIRRWVGNGRQPTDYHYYHRAFVEVV